MIEHRPLLLRSNRFLGSALVDKNLIKVDDLEAANQKLLEVIQSDNLRQASILNILLFEQMALEEADLINYTVENHSLGIVDLRNLDLRRGAPTDLDLDACWATWTLPFDHVDDIWFVATCYYLSAPTIKFWEEKLPGKIIWYQVTVGMLTDALDYLATPPPEEGK